MDEHPSEQNEKGWTERRGGKLHRGSLKRKYAKMRQSCISRKKNKTGEICRLYRGSWRDLYKLRNVNRIYRQLVRENRQIYPRRNASHRYAKDDYIYGRYKRRRILLEECQPNMPQCLQQSPYQFLVRRKNIVTVKQ